MIPTLLRIGWIQSKRDRVSQVLALVLPIVFFSIFAIIFGGLGAPRTSRPRIAVVDEARTPASARLLAVLRAEPSLQMVTEKDGVVPLDVRSARALVSAGEMPAVIVIRPGFEAAVVDPRPGRPAVTVLADVADPVTPRMLQGLLQAAIFRALPDLLLRRSVLAHESSTGTPLGDPEKRLVASLADRLVAAGEGSTTSGQPVPVELEDVVGEKQKDPIIAYYAASTGVLFLLFTVSGAAGTLLDEEGLGVLERMLNSQLTMGKLLIGRWMYNSLLGIVQVTLMFLWGSLVFKLDLWSPGHLLGFGLMTLTTAASAAAFGLVLATACRTRGQLNGLSSTVVLTMSALGGSMFPRFLMPGWMQKAGMVTFNAWALDGYRKVFWYDVPPLDLWPQLAVLAGLALVCLAVSRRLARRWETV